MKIQEAIERAIEEGKYITMEWAKNYIKIKPEMHGPMPIIIKCGEQPPGKGWQPTAEQILSDEWIVTE